MDANPDFAHLGDVVLRARGRDTQTDVHARGGPSDSLLGDIEAGKWRAKRVAGTLRKLDIGFGWPKGTADRVLFEGYDPTVGGDAQDGGYVKRADPTAGEPTSEQDDAVLQAIREMREEVRALRERMERFEQDT